jgi:geranylgeranyl diphosphate synthase, type I
MPQKKGKLIVTELKKRSQKSLILAKQMILSEKMDLQKLRTACKHHFVTWGGFIDPGLFSVACEAVGGNPDDFLQTQAAIALMAASFDLHDDILDKSETKNKHLTVYGKFGSELTLLLGDAYLIEGLKTLVDSLTKLPEEKRGSVLQSTKALLFELGNGQSLEIFTKQNGHMTLNCFLRIAELKGASMEADMMLGSVFGGGSEADIAILARLGRIVGLLIALRDELVDVFDIEELTQRILVKDLPLPLVFALRDNKTNTKINEILLKQMLSDDDIKELVDFTLHSKSVMKLKHEMKFLIDEGLNLLNSFSKKKLKSKLQDIITIMLEDLLLS